MRQDAIMEQFFEIVNVALRRDRETRRRTLSVRTYRVLPLAEEATMLEFVNNTTSLGDVLDSLHRRCVHYPSLPFSKDAHLFDAAMILRI